MFSTDTERAILLSLITAIGGAYLAGLKQTEWIIERSDSKILPKGSYVANEELKERYLSKEVVGDQYTSKQEIDRLYVPIAKFQELQADNAKLKVKTDLVDSALNHITKELIPGQLWHPNNPEFYLRFENYVEGEFGPSARLQVSFADSSPYSFSLNKFNTPKTSTFVYNGRPYELTTTLKNKKDDIYVEANLRLATQGRN
ncbi:hypothetical protein JN403_12295 [Pseudomonas sp. 15A4]|uniref:hypothetical protein n=1 Tax=Pseudomonas sp. 15A4 TaxID=2804761 RepID=UPI0019674B3D|nr:hypothetical protein [Pseudomonas sp. 15A4]QSB21527.1 hypothetical protein JN403_12295 [Pseudomonas sp. 15A4]